MDGDGKRVPDPAAHQPSKAELDEDVSIKASPAVLAWAVTSGGAKRRDETMPLPS